MSQYVDNQPLFLEPTVKQYGSHMVMTNVQKSTKKKYITIDTRFRDNYEATNQSANYTITLPERINEIKTIRVTNLELPLSFYNISSDLGNNTFTIINLSNNHSTIIQIPDGHYDSSGLQQIINSKIQANSIIMQYSTSANPYLSTFLNYDLSHNYTIDFANPTTDHRFTLGWLLGFRPVNESTANYPYTQSEFEYTVPSNMQLISTSFLDLNGPRYIYLVVDEYTSGNQNSFHSLLKNSAISKNILARITIHRDYPFGTVLPVNTLNGLLQTDTRSYNGKVNLQRMKVQLVNEEGLVLNLNGLDFSFCLEMEYE